jgi:hypothetical protein
MGWIDSIWGKRSDDPLGTLDPKLQEFLRKESPLKYDSKRPTTTTSSTTSSNPTDASSSSSSSSSSQGNDNAASAPSSSDDAAAQPPPPQSLFSDGRYAHLWRSYTPLAEIEAASKSDSEKLTDVLAAFKERKREIGRAAIENCVEWQEAWRNCYEHGSWGEKGMMCNKAVRKFERCYDTNVVSGEAVYKNAGRRDVGLGGRIDSIGGEGGGSSCCVLRTVYYCDIVIL